MISYLIDGVILCGLLVALIWGAVLARRIAKLQTALVELAPALQAFCDAVEQSERSVDDIRRETDRMEEQSRRNAALRPAATAKITEAAPARPDRGDLVRRFFDAARTRPQG